MPEDRESSIPPEAVALVRSRDSGSIRPPTELEIAETIVRNAAGPDRVTCPCCGMPDAVTPERIVNYLRMALGDDGNNTMPERVR